MVKAYIVVTTIYVPDVLYEYANNLKKFGHQEEVGFIVIGDYKTPKEAKEVVTVLNKNGFNAEYWDIDSQKKWIQQFPGLDEIVPYNSWCRINVGYLLAAEKGADIIISIDDDNHVTEDDFFLGHSIVGTTQELNTVSSSSGWFNACSMLNTEPSRHIYPRGFPYSKRWNDEDLKWNTSTGRTMINMGLWLGEPDVDAVTRLAAPVNSIGINPNRVMLNRGTYSPINTQNTAYHRDVLPCIYYVFQGQQIDGLTIDRFGDVWGSFFAGTVINHLDDRICIGHPLTNHIRHSHNLFHDLRQELLAMEITDRLVENLKDIHLTYTTYLDTYLELSEEIKRKAPFIGASNDSITDYFVQLSKAMRVWASACKNIL